MSCDVNTVIDNACTSGFGKLQNPVQLLQVIAQSAANWVAETDPTADLDVDSILTRARESGIAKVTDPQVLLALIATKLCQQV